jgi:hypothetical protein
MPQASDRKQPLLSYAELSPFSKEGRLDGARFFLCLLIQSTVFYFAGQFIHKNLLSYRQVLNLPMSIAWYGLWFSFSLFAFAFSYNLFLKRWRAVLGFTEPPKILSILLRLFLLSPLLSIWLTGFTVFWVDGLTFHPATKKSLIAFFAGFSMVIFHFGYLSWQAAHGHILINHGHFHLLNAVSARDSVSKVVTDEDPMAADKFLPSEFFTIHVFPYFTPMIKYTITAASDARRVQIISRETVDDTMPLCETRERYLGELVENCFYKVFKKVALLEPVITTMPALVAESRYRRTVQPHELEYARDSARPMAVLAPAFLTIENLVSFLETGPDVKERSTLIRPIGMLRFFASPELVLLELGQDALRFVLNRQFSSILALQLDSITKKAEEFRERLNAKEYKTVVAKTFELRSRFVRLMSDPLGIGGS